MASFTLGDVRERTYKARDAWWTVMLVDPLASRLVLVTANRTSLTPNQLTTGALLLGFGSAGCFAAAGLTGSGGSLTWVWLLIGALLYHLSFVVDCMDGKIARLKGNGSVFGAWLDYIFDRVRVLACAITLMAGAYGATAQIAYVWTGLAVVFLDMLRYLDALEIYKVRSTMRNRFLATQQRAAELRLATREAAGLDTAEAKPAMGLADALLETDPEDQVLGATAKPHVVMQQGFNKRFPWYVVVRERLLRGRIRPHLVSGIEFQMAVFIIGPLLAIISPKALIGTVAVAGAGLLCFELVIIYKFYLSSRDYDRSVLRLEKEIAVYEAELLLTPVPDPRSSRA